MTNERIRIICIISLFRWAFAVNSVISLDDYLMNEVFSFSWKRPEEILENTKEESVVAIKSFLDFYNSGVTSYLSNDWESCIENFERSNELFRDYYEALTFCHLGCEFKRRVHKPLFKQDFEQRRFFEELLFKTACIEKCRRRQLSYIPQWFILSSEFKTKFMRREQYNFLNICYYKRSKYALAASAAYTAIIGDVTNTLAHQNLKFYMKEGNVTIEELVDMEPKEFSFTYIEGIRAYQNSNFQLAMEKLESSLTTFIREVDQCRCFCDDGHQMRNDLPDFYMFIADAYMFNLRCKINCTMTTQIVKGVYYTDILPSIYEYLQHSYYQIGDTVNAVKAALSYLVFVPDGDYMLQNVELYSQLPEIQGQYLKARSEAEDFYNRNLYEMKLLNRIDQEFVDL